MEDKIYWIWLSILDLKPIEKIKLLEIFKTPLNIFLLAEKQLQDENLIKIIKNTSKFNEAVKILDESNKNNIKIIKCIDKEYPNRLLHIYDYPILLYAKGDVQLLNSDKTISIVGSRECTEYGRKITKRISFLMASENYIVISGMAKGIDSCAHIGALEANGKTIVVLGCGIEYIYPKENEKLYHSIIKNSGLIISEFPLSTRPDKTYFPMRNRIIAGLADKVLVTEARQKSGSIITAELALEQGKDIYAIPGNITSKQSQGTNELIKDGAIVVTTLEDILDM